MVRLAKKRVVFAWLFVVGAALALGASPAAADVQHVVARGHTIEAIAHRYHVTVKAIVDANHLRDTRHLKIGETLIIPGVSAKPSAASGPGAKGALAAGAKGSTAHPASYAMRPKTPGVVHATRLATNEDFTVRVSSRRGHVAPTALKSFERMMRSTSGFTHPPDPRLIALIGQVANHFGSRKLEVISGFRPYTPTQYTAHSNHDVGRALDFRVVGVPNEVLRDYCKTLHNVGVGYYPNSTFVHLDVRDTPATWIDYSKPGEPPRYNTPGVDADEGTSDVAEEVVTPETTRPGEAPLAPLPPSRINEGPPPLVPSALPQGAPPPPAVPQAPGSNPGVSASPTVTAAAPAAPLAPPASPPPAPPAVAPPTGSR
jgi:uncharacterized protein YcbK (DUF882 family)